MKPNRPAKLILLLAIAAVAYGAGFLLRGRLDAARRQTAAPQPGPQTTTTSQPYRARLGLFPPPLRRATLAEIQARLEKAQDLPDFMFEIDPMLCSLPVEDYPAMWKFCQNLKSREAREQLQNALVYLWSKKDPAHAIAVFAKLPEGKDRDYAVNATLSVWAAKDPEAALAWVASVPEKKARVESLAWTIIGIAEIDPLRALKQFNDFPDGSLRQWIASRIGAEIAHVDPEAALAMLKDCDESSRDTIVGTVAEDRVQRDLPGAIQWARQISDPKLRDSALQAVLMAGATTEPRQMAGIAAAENNPALRKKLLTGVAAIWSSKDLSAAIAWMKELPDPDSRRQAWNGIHVHMDLQSNAEFVMAEVPEGHGRLDELQSLARSVSMENLDMQAKAFAWINQMPSGPERDALVSGVSERGGTIQTAELVLTIADPDMLAKAAERVARNMGRAYPEGVADWVSRIPEGRARTGATRELADQWAHADPSGAFGWLQSLTDPSLKSQSAEAFFRATIGSRPDLATESLAFLESQKRRADLIAETAGQWMKADPDGARAWLKTVNHASQ